MQSQTAETKIKCIKRGGKRQTSALWRRSDTSRTLVSFEFECNTKETQIEITLENFSDFQFETHTAKPLDFGVQCCIEIL